MPPSARRRPPKHPALPIDLEEIEHDPGFRGMLSFLEVSPEDRAALLAKRDEAETQSPMGQSPMGATPNHPRAIHPRISTGFAGASLPMLFPGTGGKARYGSATHG